MDLSLTYLLISADLIRMLFFIASAVIGFAIAWIFLQEKLKKITKLHSTLKDSMDRLVDEYSDYKVSIDNSLAEKDEEMLRLNQQLRHNQNMAESRYEKAYRSLQEKVNNLKVENDHLKASAIKKKDAINLIEDLKTKLEETEVKLKKQDSLLMKAKSESFPRDNSMATLGYKNEILKLNNKIGKLKKFSSSEDIDKLIFINKKLKNKLKKIKAKKIKKSKPKAEKIEYIETLDVKKLMELIESGKLLKRRKTTILSKNDRE